MAEYQIQSKEAQDNILEALSFIWCNYDFNCMMSANYPGLTPNQIGSLKSAYAKLKANNPNKWNFEAPQLEIPILDKNLSSQHPTALIGGETKAEGSKVTHSALSICITFTTEIGSTGSSATTATSSGSNLSSCCLQTCQNRKRIVRRFHFDHQPNELNKPPAHIQYGGVLPENNPTLNWHYCLEHFLEPPRLHYFPMDPVLLIDLVIREFKTPLDKWRQESAWSKLVLESQKIWWSEYWNWMSTHLRKASGPAFQEAIYS